MSSTEAVAEVAANGETNRRGRPSRVAAQNASKSLKELVKSNSGRAGGSAAGKRGRPKNPNAKPKAPKKSGAGRGRPAKKAATPVENVVDDAIEAPVVEKTVEEPIAPATEE